MVRQAVNLAIRVYRSTPLYPTWGAFFAKLLHALPIGPTETELVFDTGDFKMQLDLSRVIDSNIYYTGVWEPDALATADRILKQGGTAVDIGAHIGYFSLWMAARVGKSGKVVAFEPTRWAHQRLCDNVGLNDMPQVTMVHAGLSDAPGVVQLTIENMYRLSGDNEAGSEDVELMTLDGYFAEHPVECIDFVKIDTDGFEHRIIDGAMNTLQRFRPPMLFEFGPAQIEEHGGNAQAFLNVLTGLGYSFFHEGSLAPFDNLAEMGRERYDQIWNVFCCTAECAQRLVVPAGSQ